jgi:hypothetical protein
MVNLQENLIALLSQELDKVLNLTLQYMLMEQPLQEVK